MEKISFCYNLFGQVVRFQTDHKYGEYAENVSNMWYISPHWWEITWVHNVRNI